MFFQREFKYYLLLAKYVGILGATYDHKSLKLVTTTRDTIQITFTAVVNCLASIVFLVLFYFKAYKTFIEHSETAQGVINATDIAHSLIEIVLILWIYYNHFRIRRIVEVLLNISRELIAHPQIRLRKYFWSTIVAIFILTISIWMGIQNLQMSQIEKCIMALCDTIVFNLQMLCVALYVCLVVTFKYIFTSFNMELSNFDPVDKGRLLKILRLRMDLITLCVGDFECVFGILMILFVADLIFLLSGIPVIIESISTKYIIDPGATLVEFFYLSWSWSVPLSCWFYYAMDVNTLVEEANKTARILSKISRKGTGIEKMVDKFLIKNMQHKPILTAYGFFPLNKRTLFKIFAAIFTYMVILVQFKQMENTNKILRAEYVATTTELTVS